MRSERNSRSRKLVIILLIVIAVNSQISARAAESESSLEEIRTRALEGNVLAAREIGVMYYSGNGVAQDFSEARRFLSSAAEQGDRVAERYLGIMMLRGEGYPKDVSAGIQWLEKAEKDGDEEAKKLVNELANENSSSTPTPTRENSGAENIQSANQVATSLPVTGQTAFTEAKSDKAVSEMVFVCLVGILLLIVILLVASVRSRKKAAITRAENAEWIRRAQDPALVESIVALRMEIKEIRKDVLHVRWILAGFFLWFMYVAYSHLLEALTR